MKQNVLHVYISLLVSGPRGQNQAGHPPRIQSLRALFLTGVLKKPSSSQEQNQLCLLFYLPLLPPLSPPNTLFWKSSVIPVVQRQRYLQTYKNPIYISIVSLTCGLNFWRTFFLLFSLESKNYDSSSQWMIHSVWSE